MISLRNRDVLDEKVVEELDQMSSSIRRHFYAEHNNDGTHSDITAPSVSLPSGRMGEWIELKDTYDAAAGQSRFNAQGASNITVAAADLRTLRYMLLGDMAVIQCTVFGATIDTDTADEIYIFFPELHGIPSTTTGLYQCIGMHDWQDTDGQGGGPVWYIATGAAAGVPGTLLLLGKYDDNTFGFKLWQIGANNVAFTFTVTLPLQVGNVPQSMDTTV